MPSVCYDANDSRAVAADIHIKLNLNRIFIIRVNLDGLDAFAVFEFFQQVAGWDILQVDARIIHFESSFFSHHIQLGVGA